MTKTIQPETIQPETVQAETGRAEPPLHHPGIAELFTGFLGLGLMGFGGVLPMARRMMVEDRRWLSPGEFMDLLGLCQFLPGGNIINMSVAVGLKFQGWRGALAAAFGLIAAPTAIVICLGYIYDRYRENPQVEHLFAGLAAAASGLLISLAWKVLQPLKHKLWALAIVALCFIAIAVFRLPLFATMLVLAPVSIVLSWKLSK
ncbi:MULTISPECIES: chromate transporter [Rhizobium/Agrobacterium group]|uniref:chromate transporter n=1 Tax=Rhizobium/Agrobacterium group TaxID=227290 RepID=UPI001F211044|nr:MULTISPECIES: chromate transporter [Rhizobium/Agrobacterium group]